MKQMTYGSTRFLVADAIGTALLELVTAIERGRHADLVAFPAFTEQGRPCEVQLTLHGRSELVAMSTESGAGLDEETSEATSIAVEDIRSRIARHALAVHRPGLEEDDEETAVHGLGLLEA
ncbi:hypothetical protein [Rathayibacter sp. VKM Ac-2630]|uniref:hypothetical protein n=1 Tax=Rathayibacter sp. VKM Ac-2630 TaxID=1938617 RepID=UPI000980E1DC|nr:hypothetical protein [Rathayibacter sp. VKM Ac-2630]OOB90906.1 hypothetical protein B0T42_09205 [Rathayibacter sp. VKM Ac-2630]